MMKSKLYICAVIALIILSGCSSDDDNEDFITYSPSTISFINDEGVLISKNDCVDLNSEYFVLIEVNAMGSGTIQPRKVEYTINGVLYSMTFTDKQNRTNPITLVEGENTAQLVENGFSSTIFKVNQGDFKLVE